MKLPFPLLLVLALVSTRRASAQVEIREPQDSSVAFGLLLGEISSAGRSPQDSLGLGFHPRGAWTPRTDAGARAEAEEFRTYLARLDTFSSSRLNAQERISQSVMRLRLNDEIDGVRYRMHLIPFNAEGGFYNSLGYALDRLPFGKTADYRAYFRWLPHYATSLRENLDLLRLGLAEGIVAPRVVVDNSLRLLDAWAVARPEDSPLYEPLTRFPTGIPAADRDSLRREGESAIAVVNVAYAELKTFLGGDYRRAAPEQPGVSGLPGGREYYENRVRHYTTLPLTADSVHRLGLREVARVRASMDSVISALGFGGSFPEFLDFLRSDPRFYAKTPEELLHRAAWISKRAEGQLPRYFDQLPSLPFTVEPVPADIAPTYTPGRYVGGSWPQRRPGTYWVNTYDLPSRTLYTLPALTLHEAVPGHHLQGSLAAEIDELPDFRKRYYISAFGEGWGLYSEFLGEEMGMYTTAYELFGRYTYEMWRACRLVIDTGIHGKGWSRQRALDYLADNTALSLHEVTTEIDRYIGWPGQAVSYKVGELHIKSLRRRAEEELGSRFNIGEFHDAILRNGSVPLTILTDEVEAYIARAQTRGEADK